MNAPRFTDEQLGELLRLIEGADSVELKVTVPDAGAAGTVDALGMDPLDSVLRQVYFFDTPGLDLEASGIVVRARRTQGRPDDTVVKLRPVVPSELPGDLRAREAFGVEVDAMPGGFVCSASFKGEVKSGRVRETIAGDRPLSKLFSMEQRSFYEEHAPGGIGFEDLAVLGPVHALKLKGRPDELPGKLVAELWFYPDGSRILELSTKCRPAQAMETAARTRVYLAERGIDLSGEQQTKTRTALDFFAAEAHERVER
jgi:hypothetical protein